jgi:hypothetical protein
MKKYAFFLSLTDNYTFLFNAFLNSVELFGTGKYADVVVIHDDSIKDDYKEFIAKKTASMDTDVRFIPIVTLPEDNSIAKVMRVKYYRYKIMAEEGQNYESICFIDTDIYLASDVHEYFEIAANTNLFVGVNDNVIRHYKKNVGQGTCPRHVKDGQVAEPFFDNEIWDGKFICNTPMFIDVAKYGHVFLDVFAHRGKIGMDNTFPFTGDLDTMNIILNKHRVKNNLVVLASHLWTNVHHSIYRTSLMCRHTRIGKHIRLSDEGYKSSILFMSETHEHVRAFHGRDWASKKSADHQKGHNIPKLLRQMEGEYDQSSLRKRENVFNDVQAYFLFLQFNCSISIEDVHKIIPVREIDYLLEMRDKMSAKIRSFMG